MPGILPMKVIKVGNNSQARIAQACDRCRSKKIKCDGIRPCCTQCANVGFECKTSDKLSRRAFPRGYTESLEERVRSLEAEVRELKDLLDEKDEKIDMLSKMHSNRQPSHSSIALTPSLDSREESLSPKDDLFRVQASPLLLGSENADSYFMGASSGRAFVDAFKRKIHETGKSCSSFNTEAFLNVQRVSSTGPVHNLSRIECIPPRLFSDKCVQIFWQEWAPLFPLLNKSGFLRLYEEYISDPEKMDDNHKLAQLHLVFGIAALSSEFPEEDQISLCESQWKTSLNAILMENTLLTLQCLTLATLYSLLKGDYKRLQQYRGISIALAHRLGLHQSQKRFSFGALTMEMRKKVFWTLYTVDCFSAATVGLPTMLNDEDIHCEYPTDIDDEYITEKGFLPTLPGESSKVSAALALFRVSRILSKVLVKNYPAAASHDLSLQSLSVLETELNEWSDNLPPHLKLTFVQDKPSTDITGDRSALLTLLTPVLSLAYYYIRTLIHRPAVGSTLASKSSSSVISLADSSKHIIQIMQLLEERSMSFSFCVNKNEVLTLCGLSLLYQGLDLKQEGKLMKDGQRLVSLVVKFLEKANAPGALDFRRLSTSMMSGDSPSQVYAHSPDSNMSTSSVIKASPSPGVSRNQPAQQSPHYYKIECSNENDLLQHKERVRQATLPISTYKHSNTSQSSLDSAHSESSVSRHEYKSSLSQIPTPLSMRSQGNSNTNSKSRPNLDYLSLSDSPVSTQTHFHVPLRSSTSHNLPVHTPNFPPQPSPLPISASQNKNSSVTPAEWENLLLSTLDSGDSNIYDAVYGGPSTALTSTLPNPSYQLASPTSSNHSHTHSLSTGTLSDLSVTDHSLTTTLSKTSSGAYGEWSPEAWDMTTLQLNDFDINNGPAQSVLSYSEESLSSGDDLDGFSMGTGNGNGNGNGNGSGRHSFDDLYRNTAPVMSGDGFLFEGLDGGFIS